MTLTLEDRDIVQAQIGENIISDSSKDWKTYENISDTKAWGTVVCQRSGENKIKLMGIFGSKAEQQILIFPPTGYKFSKFTESGTNKTNGLTTGFSNNLNMASTGISTSSNTGLTIRTDGSSLYVWHYGDSSQPEAALCFFIGLQGPVEVEIEKES